jgi:hypothetical protein
MRRWTDKTLKLNMVLSVWVSLLRVHQWRAVTRQVLYYLRDSAACPQGDLPWSSRHFSASPEYVDAWFLMFTSHMTTYIYTHSCTLYVYDTHTAV